MIFFFVFREHTAPESDEHAGMCFEKRGPFEDLDAAVDGLAQGIENEANSIRPYIPERARLLSEAAAVVTRDRLESVTVDNVRFRVVRVARRETGLPTR